MIKQEIVEQRRELSAELRQYLDDHREIIKDRQRKVAAKGVAGAATESDRVANARHATVAEGLFEEANVGTDDKAPIYFLERGAWASRAVCRLVDYTGTALGSGFLVAPGVLITNHHVLPTASTATDAVAEFAFELDGEENPVRPVRFLLEPERLFVTSPRGALDFSFVAVAALSENGQALAAQGWLPLDERPGKILDGQPIVIIQHPDGQMKAICLFDSVCVYRDPEPDHPYLLYTTDTDFGSSGSPAFNRFWQVVALHHAALETGERREGRPVTMNRGIRISSIFKALRASDAAAKGSPADAAEAAKVRGTPAQIAATLSLLTDPQTRKRLRPFQAAALRTATAGDPAGGAVVIAEGKRKKRPRGTVIRRHEADHFDDRDGYDPMFLALPPGSAERRLDPDGGHALHVPLPSLPDWLRDDAAPLLNPEDGADPHELKYEHFSIVLSASRKLAVLTACNVDGSRMVKLPREDRNPDDPLKPDLVPEAAADTWYYDPRVAEDHQLGPELYDRTDFDYGHLVRRLDPVWADPGDLRTPRIANDDTFTMANCSPQESRFHRTRSAGDGNWSALEDVILEAADLTNKRFTVLTGPVLDTRDPVVLGVKIPTAFWKIAMYEQSGNLRAHGFLLWQSKEVGDVQAKLEGLAVDLSQARKPVPLREIARLTGLDFGPLFEVDVLA